VPVKPDTLVPSNASPLAIRRVLVMFHQIYDRHLSHSDLRQGFTVVSKGEERRHACLELQVNGVLIIIDLPKGTLRAF
jgi:hypothetical protein